ncbi:MAG: HAD family hydrolase [Archangium sp.]|nr:HAD family hydrolase [Archangium sp.]
MPSPRPSPAPGEGASRPIHALIFDLDGTLADSIADIGNAMNAVLAGLSLPPHTLDAYKSFVGEGAENLARRSVRAAKGLDWRIPSDDGLPRSIAELTESYRVEYGRLEHGGSTAYPGIDAMLDGVVASGRKMAVLSNKRDDFTRHLVTQAFGRWPFVDVRGERDGVPRKPDPTAAYELALELNVIPANIGFVGDTPIDVGTARNAGMIPIGVLWGFRTREELTQAGAKFLLEQPKDLLALLR